MKDSEYLIHRTPISALIIFALPMMLGNLFQQFYTMADSVIVGRFVGEKALAAVGASYALTTVFISIAIGGGIGASVVASRAFGAKRYGMMKSAISTSLITFLVLSIILGMIGYIFSPEIMSALNTPEDILADAISYLRIYFLGLPFLFMYNVLASMFNALGKSKIPLFLLIFSSILNIFLDIYMVRNLGMGVDGAAWATLIAQGISAIISFMVLLRTLSAFNEKNERIWSSELFRTISLIALPSILQQSTVSIGMMLVQSVVNSFGSEVLAGFSAAMRIESIAVVPMSAMGNAMSSYTAQNLGADKTERVVKGYHASYLIVAVLAILIMIPLETVNTWIIKLFIGSEGTAAAMATGTGYLSFMGWFFALIGFKMITDGLLRGAGDMTPFMISTFSDLILRVGLAIIFSAFWGSVGIWLSWPVGWAVGAIVSLIFLKSGHWIRYAERNRL